MIPKHRNRRRRRRRSGSCQVCRHGFASILTLLSSSALSERFRLPPRPLLPPLPRPRPRPRPLPDPLADVGVAPKGDAPTSVFNGVPTFPPCLFCLQLIPMVVLTAYRS